jgi:gliding motility-associated-like protein
MRILSCFLKGLLLTSFVFIACINSKAQLHADFTSNVQQGCSPLVVQFEDFSTGNPTDWFWDLGNGATSVEQDPGAFYIAPGNYTITLHIKNVAGEDSVTKVDYITVYEKPSVAFSADPPAGCGPLDVQFTDESKPGSGTIASWIWDFGDGITSSLQNPLHTYNVLDTFDVTLTVVNSFGCKTTLQQQAFIKIKGLVQAGFSYKYNNVCKPPTTVRFTNTSQAAKPLTYEWSFGDGTTSTSQDPVHTYSKTGNFTVQLKATNPYGCSNTYSEVITVGSIKADFDFTNTCLNETALFTDNSTPIPINEIWDFGDGTTDTGYQVTHIYQTSGSYNIRLIAYFGNCKDTVIKTINIDKKPVADFIASNKYVCSFPATIIFNNESKGATGYKWFFGDGDSATAVNPSHEYKQPGEYSVSLIAYNAYGCSDTIGKSNFITIGLPQIQGIENLPVEGCAPQTLTLNPLIDSNITIASYYWDFGDGSTSNSPQPAHNYNAAGVYTVTLVIKTSDGCLDTLVVPSAVTLGNRPRSDFYGNPLNGCAETPIQFTDDSKGVVTSWLWDFGDGKTSIKRNPKHTYYDTGYFDVTLIVSQYGCSDTLLLTKYVYIQPPVAKFRFSASCKDPYTYSFGDSSIAPKSWAWDFGDGATSTNQNEVHTYNSTGKFDVSLTVTNGACSFTTHDTVNVVDEKPSFNYKFLSTNSCKLDSIRFTINNYDTANIRYFLWDFGDSVSKRVDSTDDVTYHYYRDAGLYTPTLFFRDVNNCFDSISQIIQIQVFGPKAAFSNKQGDCLLSTINFKDQSLTDSIHAITTWIWNYGDGSPPDTLMGPPFEHTYTTKGVYDVSLKVIDNNNCYDTITNGQSLSITSPVADFIADDTLTCEGSLVQFIDSSQLGIQTAYNWNFGDGQNSNAVTPVHAYSKEGLYDVKLVVVDKYKCVDSVTKLQYIRVTNPRASFILPDSIFLCPPLKISPVNTSVNYTSVLWDFGDGLTSSEPSPEHYYISPGTYAVKLITKGNGECFDTAVKLLTLKGPSATLSYLPVTGCNPLKILFSAKAKNTVQYIWDFGNGVTQITQTASIHYTYPKPGKFSPQLLVVDQDGCQVAVTNPDTVIVSGGEANFAAVRVPGICDSALFNFTDSSLAPYDKIQSYSWKFGDGDSASDANPQHYYNRAKSYNVSLSIITQSGCESYYTLPVNVVIDSTPKVVASIPDTACAKTPVLLSAGVINSSSENFSWVWNLGNGDQGYTNDASYTYPAGGNYNVYVVGTSFAGCSDTVSQITHIGNLPATNAGPDAVICKDASFTLTATGAEMYAWSPQKDLSCTTCINPVATPLFNTTYFLTGSTSFGCKTQDSVYIEVKRPPHLSVEGPDTSCAGSTIQLKATGAELYSWQPASEVTNSTDSITSSNPSSNMKYSVIGTDSKGCFRDTAVKRIKVFPIPTVTIPDSVVSIPSGGEFRIDAKGSRDVTAWQWTPVAGLSCSECPNPMAKPLSSTIYTVEVKNIAGCKAQSQISFEVKCKGHNLFIPNTFSPNGDGMNDYFYPRGKSVRNIKSFRIFNRWGSIVFERSDFPPNQQSYGWDGAYKGKALQADVYVFIAEVECENGEIITSKGNVTLLR